MKKMLSTFICAVLMATTSLPTVHAFDWRATFDFNFRNSEVLPYIGAGIAAAGGIALASWLLSESDQDVINAAHRQLETIHHQFADIWYVFERYPYDTYAQDDHLKALIGQQYGHEKFYLINCRTAINNYKNSIRTHADKVQQRLRNVEGTLNTLSQFDANYEIARTTRKQLTQLSKSMNQAAVLLEDLYKRIGSWHEYAVQQKKYKKHLKKLERERQERERERKLREQQWEIERLNRRMRQLEREARDQRCCNECREPNCVHLEFGW